MKYSKTNLWKDVY